jgi:MinD-like ATPase involved in chromosome partitioning or flagellar assembly
MLRVTFYSYKGGVGRTLALLNVAAALARAGRRVVAVDLDLEAPGFGLSELTRQESPQLGVSDFLLDRRVGGDSSIADHAYPILRDECEDRLRLISVGTRTAELVRLIPSFYSNPEAEDAGLFQRLVMDIDVSMKPDYLLFDSRAGKADVAGVCTVELPQVLVAVCGLDAQSVNGMERILRALTIHPARVVPVATVLALSPVPRPEDVGLPSVADVFARHPGGIDVAELERERRSNVLLDAIYRAQARLLPGIWSSFEQVRPYFPGADRFDVYHQLPYDPMIPLMDELQIARDTPLGAAYRLLAYSLTRLHPSDEPLDVSSVERPPVLVAA